MDDERDARRGEQGQATVEYALVLVAFLSVVLALAALWRAGRDGMLTRLAREAASHALEAERLVDSARDLLLY